MELNHTQIPDEFIKTLPDGMKFIHKHGKDFLVVEEVSCPKGHSLMVESVQIHGEPTIRIDVRLEGQMGSFFIDSYWGSHAKLYDFMPRLGKGPHYVEAFCPTCGTSLMTGDKCEQEGCKTESHIVLTLPGKDNRILVCSRLGCPGHKIDIRNLPPKVTESVSEINYFGAGADDIFKGI